MEKELEKDVTVDVTVDEEIIDKKQNESDKANEKKPWKLGPITIDLKPKTAKRAKVIGAGLATICLTALGAKVGGWSMGIKKDTIINAQAAEIAKLKSVIDAAPAVIETAAEVVAEVAETVPEAVEEVISEEV